VNNICDIKEIPLLETRLDETFKHVINLHPTPESLGKVFMDLIKLWNWKGFTILYEDVPWLQMVQYVLVNYKEEYTVAVRQLDVAGNGNYRPMLYKIKESREHRIIISSSIESLPEILKQAQQVGILTEDHHILITSLDMHTIDLEPFQYGGTNITGMRMIIPENPLVKEFSEYIEEMRDQKTNMHSYHDSEREDLITVQDSLTNDNSHLRLETTLTVDAGIIINNFFA
jgi:glutamate receptor, ionotropic, invertebrate